MPGINPSVADTEVHISMAFDLGKQIRLVQETEKETFKACLQFGTQNRNNRGMSVAEK